MREVGLSQPEPPEGASDNKDAGRLSDQSATGVPTNSNEKESHEIDPFPPSSHSFHSVGNIQGLGQDSSNTEISTIKAPTIPPDEASRPTLMDSLRREIDQLDQVVLRLIDAQNWGGERSQRNSVISNLARQFHDSYVPDGIAFSAYFRNVVPAAAGAAVSMLALTAPTGNPGYIALGALVGAVALPAMVLGKALWEVRPWSADYRQAQKIIGAIEGANRKFALSPDQRDKLYHCRLSEIKELSRAQSEQLVRIGTANRHLDERAGAT